MDILSSLMSSKGSELISGLVGKGFSMEQAEKFLPEAGGNIMSALSGNESEKDTDSILEKIDIASLASKVGIDSSMATTGLKQLLPVILNQMGGSGLGGLMGKVKSFF